MTTSHDTQTPEYDAVYAESLLRTAAADDGVPDPALRCCDAHPADALALRWLSADGDTATMTFGQLKERSCRFANWLRAQGIGAGDVVAVLLPRVPELVVALLGTMRVGAIYQPLFTAFGPKAVEDRVRASGARLIVTDAANLPKLDGVGDVPVVLAGDAPHRRGPLLRDALASQPAGFASVARRPEDPMLLLYTSGTTGKPKGVQVPVRALRSFETYMRYGIGLRPTDTYWNIADPGWAYGLFYAVIGPLLLGHATTFYAGPFTAESTYRVIRELGVDNLAGSPTAYRLLMAEGDGPAASIRGRLRVVSSAGEALNPEVMRWFADALDAPVHDHYGQTEAGMVLANHHGLRHPVTPGTAGRPMPGVRAAILGAGGEELPPGQVGELALDRAGSPEFWFRGYWAGPGTTPPEPDRYHRTGDLARMDADATVTFVGRADDVITSSGYRIGPFDVESTLMEHPAVAETAVIGKPDPTRTELVKAFVVLRKGHAASPELAEALQQHVKGRLAAHAYPREVEFVAELPKTPSGKIQRYLLRDRERARG